MFLVRGQAGIVRVSLRVHNTLRAEFLDVLMLKMEYGDENVVRRFCDSYDVTDSLDLDGVGRRSADE